MRHIPALFAVSALACLGVSAVGAPSALASVSVPAPFCDSSAGELTCAAQPGAPSGPSITWTVSGPGGTVTFKDYNILDYTCLNGRLYVVSDSYVVNGVTYVSATTGRVRCSDVP